MSSRSSSGSLLVKMQSDSYAIKEGDQVEVSAWGYPEFNTKATVTDGGTITMPLVGDLKAAGLTKDQFSELVRSKLSQFIKGDIKLSISVAGLMAQRVAVLGAVVRQENYPVVGDVSLVELLSSAGGATTDSDLHHVKIIRNGNAQEPLVVDVQEYVDNGSAGALPSVRAGDMVFVPKKENVIRGFSDFLRDVVLLFGFFRVFY